MEDELNGLLDYLEAQLEQKEGRILLSIASIPGGGKSTLAFLLAQSLNRTHERAKVVGLDGWHYSRAQLDEFEVTAILCSPKFESSADVFSWDDRIRRTLIFDGEQKIRSMRSRTANSSRV